MEQLFRKKGNLEQLLWAGFEGDRRTASPAFNFEARQVGRVADYALDLRYVNMEMSKGLYVK